MIIGGEKVSIIKSILEEEYDRLERMKKAYSVKIASLPKGSIQEKKIRNHVYYYWVYREGGQTINKYLEDDEALILRRKIEQRKKFEKEIQSIDEDFKIIRRAIRV